jgi:hypothetical protein
MLNPSIRAVITEKLSDRAYAELHGYTVCLREFVPGELRLVGVERYIVVCPNGFQGPEVAAEDLAWEMAAYFPRATADNWARARRRSIEAITPHWTLAADPPLAGEFSNEEAVILAEISALSVGREASPDRTAAPVERSVRLNRLQLQQVISGKDLPLGREANIAFLKELLPATSAGIKSYPKEKNETYSDRT